VVVDHLGKLQQRYQTMMQSGMVERVLLEGSKRAQLVANATLQRVKKVIGLW
jgi:hypothetical protein